MTRPLSVGLAGLGTVGGGVLRLLRENAEIITARAGRPVAVTAVSARDRGRDRGCSLAGLRWFEEAPALAADPAVDVVVELIGGAEGTARALVEAALAAGKPVVTANKALLAVHGAELAARAEAAGVVLAFEAAVAGGIPVIKALREGASANRITRVYGILNGTCNFILTKMESDNMSFEDALDMAKRLGYAELNPSADVDGHAQNAGIPPVPYGAQASLARRSLDRSIRATPTTVAHRDAPCGAVWRSVRATTSSCAAR